MSEIVTKAVVVGGGPAGLAAAALLAQSGVETVCLAPKVALDPRTTALMMPSLRLLERLGVWNDDIRQHCAPLKHLHILDDTGNLVSAPDLRFAASEANLDAFGWNTPLAVFVPALSKRAIELGVTMIDNTAFDFTVNDSTVTVKTNDGLTITASFVVGADGRNSPARKAAGIAATEWSYAQSALVTRFSHSRDHEGTSTEWHKMGGPFTTVPLPGKHSALVWMDTPRRIDDAMQLSPQHLAREIQLQNHGALGLISSVETPHSFAMRGVKAERFAAKRVFLVGEAAHVFPPVGAQGLNMSLRDVGHLVDVVLRHEDAGCEAATRDYDSLRRSDVLPRQAAITLMNKSLLADIVPPHLARAAGLAAVAYLQPLRKIAMEQGLAPASQLPFAMRE